jgi:hypothetical protein
VLKTTQSIKQDGQVVVPKGSRLIGRVTEVQRRTKENGRSSLAMAFDRIQGRDLSIPITATITTVTSAAEGASVGDSVMSDVSGSSGMSSSSRRPSSGGGLLGGVQSTVGGVVGTTTQAVGTVANTTGQALGSTSGAATRTINGLTISAEAGGSANSSTTLSAPGKNLRFEKGSTFFLRVAN